MENKYIGLVSGKGGNLGLIFEKAEDGKYYTDSHRLGYNEEDIQHDLKLGCIEVYTEENKEV